MLSRHNSLFRRPNNARRSLTAAALLTAVCGTAGTASADIIQWLSATSGVWSNPALWEDNNVPNSLLDVAYIGKTGANYVITVDFDVPMEALTLNSPNATINLNGNRWMFVAAVHPDSFCHVEQGTFNVTGGATLKSDREIAITNPNALMVLNNGAVEGGTLLINDGGMLQMTGTGYLRTGVTQLFDTGSILINDGVTGVIDVADHVIQGSGTLLLNGSYYGSRLELRADAVNEATIRLSNHPSNSLAGQNLPAADFVLTNAGLIHGGGAVGQNTTSIDNGLTGTIQANVPTPLYLDPGPEGMINNGLLTATNGATLYLQAGTYDSTVPAEGTAHAADASRVVLNSSAVLVGHTLSTAGSGYIDLVNATLTDDGLNPSRVTGFARILDGATGYMAGGIDVTGELHLASSYYGAVMAMSGDSYFSGGGLISMANHPAGAITSTPAHAHWLSNLDCTFRGSGQFGSNTMGIENYSDGRIEASGSTGLTLNPSDSLGMRNEGVLTALGGSKLILNGPGFDSTGGTIHAADNGVVQLSGAQITGGTFTSAGSGYAIHNVNNSILRDVTSSGMMHIADGVTTRVESTLANTGTLNLAGSYYGAVMYVQGGPVQLQGGGTVTLSDHPSNQITGVGGNVLINQDNLITGAGSLGANLLAIVNNDTIQAAGGNGLVVNPIDAGGLDNNGVLRASGGGKLYLDGPGFDNAGGVIHAADAGIVFLRTAGITGGQFTAAGTGYFINTVNQSVLRDITSSSPVFIQDGVTTRFENSYVNEGKLTLAGSYYGAVMHIQNGNFTLSGGGTLALSDHPSNTVNAADGAMVFTNQDNLITGAGAFGGNLMTIVNNGIIEGAGGYGLVVNPTDAGGLDNNGDLRTAVGSKLYLDGPGFDNTGGVIHAADNSGVYLRTATITGGLLTAGGTGAFYNSVTNSSLSNLTIAAPTYINDGTAMYLAGTIGLPSTLTANASYYGATVIVQNALTLTGTGTLAMSNHPSATITGNVAGATLTNSGVTIRGSGQIGANLLTILNGPGGTIQADQGYPLNIDPNNTGGMTNHGTMRVNTGATMNIVGGPFTTSGKVFVSIGSKLNRPVESFVQTGGLTIANGEIEVGSDTYLLQGGALGGTGLVDSVVSNTGGVLSPGEATGTTTGTLTIDGGYAQSLEGEMYIEVGGRETGEFDRATVMGIAALNGTLRLANLNGFVADPGDQFTIMTSTEPLQGSFFKIIQPVTGPRWGVTYVAKAVVLTAFCGADFDDSGFVDTDDFTAFVTSFEAGTEDADFDGTGFVDTDDFTAFVIAFEAGC